MEKPCAPEQFISIELPNNFNIMKIKLSILISLLYSSNLFAQIEPIYGLYRFNSLVINPAQAGSTPNTQINCVSRWQWTQLEGGPLTNAFSVNMPFKSNTGFGATIVSDNIGPVRDLYIGLDYGYHLKLNNSWKLSAGLRLGIINHSVNLASLSTVDQNDLAFKTNLNTGYRINPGLGFLLTNKQAYFGVSVPRILKYTYGSIRNISQVKDVTHYFLYGGINKRINSDIIFRPSININFISDVPINIDLNATVTLKDFLDIGLMYRHKDAIGLIFGYQFKSNFYAGYCIEYPVSLLNKANFITNEFALRYTIGNFDNKKILTPRYFN